MSCEQTPTTLDEEPFIEESEITSFSAKIASFEFDILSWEFFFSVNATTPYDSLNVNAELLVSGDTIATFSLNDSGMISDIQINDGSYDQNWTLPDSMSAYIDSLWTLSVQAISRGEVKEDIAALQPERPIAPIIESINHQDTLTLLPDNLILDTLTVTINHPKGRDTMRDVSIMSLKPDSSYSNGGQPIQLYDDGSRVVFFIYDGIEFTSGDQVAGDGIYTLVFAFNSDDMIGKYHWTFNARTWLGLEAEPVLDSLVVLPPSSLPKARLGNAFLKGVFQ
jgi:hypothetical protein